MPLDFPVWLRATHILNILFLSLLARSGIEILSAHPKLYWNDDCRPGSEWLRFTRKKRPRHGLWTSKEEEESFSSWIVLPGHGNLGLGRHWHFANVVAWVLTGIAYVVLLFVTDEWRRLIPTSWDIVPQTWDVLLTYLTFKVPTSLGYNAVQQVSYAAVVFLLAPFMLATGAAMSPAIAAQFPRYLSLFGGRQSARSLHFLSLLAFAGFTIIHTAMVVVHGLPNGLELIVLGVDAGQRTRAIIVGVLGLIVIGLIHAIGTSFSLRSPRRTQHLLGAVVDPLQQGLSHITTSKQYYPRAVVSPYFRVNGRPPQNSEYEAWVSECFTSWTLEVRGLIQNPLVLSLDDLRAMPPQSQITKHHCIEGWSNVGEWTGVPLRHLFDQCRPLPSARYVVFYALNENAGPEPEQGAAGGYYEVIDLALAYDPQTILAYDMNGGPLSVPHGAPLRLRLETQLGFKMVKYLHAIELVDTFKTIGEGQGGWREDVQFYSREAGI